MKRRLVVVAACAAALLGSGIAHADPDPASPDQTGPDPNGPKCWVTNDEGHAERTPCGWAYSDSSGWYQVPWGWQT